MLVKREFDAFHAVPVSTDPAEQVRQRVAEWIDALDSFADSDALVFQLRDGRSGHRINARRQHHEP